MIEKINKNQSLARRKPTQARSLHKVELILEAAMQLSEIADIASLTTNAVAAKAGVSIGTLYQYFDSKEALLDALADREMAVLSERVMSSMNVDLPVAPGSRVRAVVHAILQAYGGRKRVHRLLLERAMRRGSRSRLLPLFAQLSNLLSSGATDAHRQPIPPIKQAEAFVLTHAIAGALRGMVSDEELHLPLKDVEDALVRLVLGFYAMESTEHSPGK
jgi:AcrR family transcriptional regulator